MANRRELRDRDLDAAGFIVTGLPTAANPSDAVRFDQMQAGDTANGAAISAEAAARAAADALIPGTITALTSDVTASGTGAVPATLTNIPQTVLLARTGALTADVPLNNHKLTGVASGGTTPTNGANIADTLLATAFGVASKAALIAIDTTALNEGTVRRVRTYRRTFWLDKTNTYTPKDGEVFAPTTGGGFWVWDGSADPFWLTETAYTINASTGDDENLTALKTRTELARRLGSGKLPAPITVTITGNLASDDTTMPRCQSDFTNFISWIGVPTVLFTGLVTGYVARSGAARQPTMMTCSGLTGTSWSDSGPGSTSLVGKVIEWTDGAGAFICARVVEDLGLKVATLSPPIRRPTNLEDVFVNGTTRTLGATTINVYDLPALPSPLINRETNTQYSYLSATQWLNFRGGLTMTNCTGECAVNGGVVNQINGRGIGAGFTIAQDAFCLVVGGHQRLICGAGAIRINVTGTITSIQIETNGVVSAISGGSAGTIDIEVNNSSTSLPVIVLNGIDGGRLHCQGFVYGKSAISSGHLAEFQGRSGLVSFSQTPNVTGAALIAYTLAGTTDNVSVLATRESNDVNGNRFIGPAGPTVNDNRSAPMANLGSGGATTTNAANIGDVQTIAAAAAVPSTAGAIAVAGHAGFSLLGKATTGAGNAADIPVGTDSVSGRIGSGNVGDVPMTAAGRAMAGAASATAQTALLDTVTPSAKGLAPLSGGGTANFLRADGTWATPPGTGGAAITALTGDVAATGPGSAAATIAAGAVTNVKRANMAASTLSGNATGSPAAPTDLTAAAVKTLLAISFSDIASTVLAAQFPALTGDVTTPGGSLATTLANLPQSVLLARAAALTAPLDVHGQQIINAADPTTPQALATRAYVLAQFSGGVPLTDGNKGDVTVSASGATWLINALAVTFAKMQSIATQTLIGRQTAGTGAPESIGVGGGVEFDGSGNLRVGAFTGDVSKSAGSAGTVINPNAVTNAQLAPVPTGTVKGRTAAGTGNASDLTFAALKAAIAISFLDVSGTLQAAQFPALTGDVTTTAGSLATTLAASGVTAGTLGDASHSLTLTVDAKGRVLAVSAPSISITAGAVSGLSAVQTGALTGDVTKPAGSGTTTLVNIPNDTTVPGDILGVASAPPATPAAGHGRFWYDSTDKIWKNVDDVGLATHMVRAQPAFAHNFVTEIKADGRVSIAQPSFADLSGNIIASQLPVPGNSIIGNNTGSTAPAAALSVSDVRAMLDLWDGPFLHSFVGTFGHNPMWITNDNLSYTVPRGWTMRAGASKIFVRVNLFDTSFGGRNISVTLEQRSGHAGSPTTLLTMGPYGGTVEDSSTASVTLGAGDEIDVKLGGSFSAGVDSGAMFVGVWFQ